MKRGPWRKTTFFIREYFNGTPEPTGDRDHVTLNSDGHYEIDLILTGDEVRLYFEKGTGSDDGVATTCYVDNFRVTQNRLEIIEENNYYPFGLKHKGYNTVVSSNSNSVASRFKYNGTELEESLGLNLYEMDMRQYDPTIARWTSIDPVTHHSMSTYTAFDNNPVFWADPSGADAILFDDGAHFTGSDAQNAFASFVNGMGTSEDPPGNEGCCKGLKETWESTKQWFSDLLTWGGTEEEVEAAEEARAILNSADKAAKKVWETEKEVFSYFPGGSILTSLIEEDYEGAAANGAVDTAFSLIPGGIIVKKGGKKSFQKIDILFDNRSSGMNWVRNKLGHNTDKLRDANGKVIGLINKAGDKVYWGHNDWYIGPGNSKFPHLNYEIGNQKGHLFLKDKIVNSQKPSVTWEIFKSVFLDF